MKHRNGETRTCPYCGQKSVYYGRLAVPEAGATPAVPGEASPVTQYKAGWKCENAKCSRRYDLD